MAASTFSWCLAGRRLFALAVPLAGRRFAGFFRAREGFDGLFPFPFAFAMNALPFRRFDRPVQLVQVFLHPGNARRPQFGWEKAGR